MKKAIKYLSFGLVSVLTLSACSDQFLEDKTNYDNVTSDIYNYYSGANGRLDDIYSWCIPYAEDLTQGGLKHLSVSMGSNDLAGCSTEEYHGFTDFIDPTKELGSIESSTNAVPDFFMGKFSDIQSSFYGRIRNINDFIIGVTNGALKDEEKDALLGQAYFFRGWCYYNLVKWYGGVPIVTEILDPVEGSYTPRSSTKDCIDFICADLDRAAKLLAKKTMGGGWTGTDYGRVTTGTALALKGRVLLLWCSPIFNRQGDESRWQDAYKQMKQELDSINACGYGLYQSGTDVCASNFANQFLTSTVNPEAVFVTLYNNIEGDGLDVQKNNPWERGIRPANTGGSGKAAGLALVELFPMADGKIPNLSVLQDLEMVGARTYKNTYTKLERSAFAYDESAPFMNRDPRFYRTFAMPGFRWAYNGDASEKDVHNPSDGKNYTLWNYVFPTSLDPSSMTSSKTRATDNLSSKTGIYVRKKSDDLDVNSSPLYQYVAADTKGAAPFYSAAPLIELRYAEVLLNMAEAACMAGQMAEAVGYLQQIRARVGYTSANNYGLQTNLASDKATCMSAILYERQIELAYEGKRFDDMRRWMLFDGGSQLPDGAPASWKVGGIYGTSTCTWLGFKQWNGQRRENVQFKTAEKYGIGQDQWDGDPLLAAGTVRPDGVNFGAADFDTQLANLKTWYNDNLVTDYKTGDGYDQNRNPYYINFRPKYYLLGFNYGVQNQNPNLPQTIGWQDANNGGANGTFDPLAE